MAITLLDLVIEVLRSTGQNPNKTAFSETDSTQFIVDRINDGLDVIYGLAPSSIDADGSLTLPASTRSVAAVSGLDPYHIYDWSWRINQSVGDIALEQVSEKFVIKNFPLYETYEAAFPKYVYLSNGVPSFYPLLKAGSASLTIQYKYPAQMVKLTETTATFPFQDRSEEMTFLKLYAKFQYELFKLMGNPDFTGGMVEDAKGALIGKYEALNPFRIAGNARFGA